MIKKIKKNQKMKKMKKQKTNTKKSVNIFKMKSRPKPLRPISHKDDKMQKLKMSKIIKQIPLPKWKNCEKIKKMIKKRPGSGRVRAGSGQ